MSRIVGGGDQLAVQKQQAAIGVVHTRQMNPLVLLVDWRTLCVAVERVEPKLVIANGQLAVDTGPEVERGTLGDVAVRSTPQFAGTLGRVGAVLRRHFDVSILNELQRELSRLAE